MKFFKQTIILFFSATLLFSCSKDELSISGDKKEIAFKFLNPRNTKVVFINDSKGKLLADTLVENTVEFSLSYRTADSNITLSVLNWKNSKKILYSYYHFQGDTFDITKDFVEPVKNKYDFNIKLIGFDGKYRFMAELGQYLKTENSELTFNSGISSPLIVIEDVESKKYASFSDAKTNDTIFYNNLQWSPVEYHTIQIGNSEGLSSFAGGAYYGAKSGFPQESLMSYSSEYDYISYQDQPDQITLKLFNDAIKSSGVSYVGSDRSNNFYFCLASPISLTDKVDYLKVDYSIINSTPDNFKVNFDSGDVVYRTNWKYVTENSQEISFYCYAPTYLQEFSITELPNSLYEFLPVQKSDLYLDEIAFYSSSKDITYSDYCNDIKLLNRPLNPGSVMRLTVYQVE